jgi:hypothetical protein
VRAQGRGDEGEPRERFRRGLPDHHDPTGGVGGAAPAYSALTLRLVLATFGLVACAAGGVWLWVLDAPALFSVTLLLLAVLAVVDIAVVIRRKRRGEPG